MRESDLNLNSSAGCAECQIQYFYKNLQLMIHYRGEDDDCDDSDSNNNYDDYCD